MKKERKPLFEVPTEHEKEWQGMPEFTQKDITSIQHIIVHFTTREDVDAFAKLIGRSLSKKTNSIWFPDVPPARTSTRHFVDEEMLNKDEEE
jgi:hypothetical protein